MMKELDNILKKTLAGKPSRLSFGTTYDHSNLFDWLQTFLPDDWTIIKPKKSCVLFPVLISPENRASLPCEYKMLYFPSNHIQITLPYNSQCNIM